MVTCVVYGCSSRGERKEPGISFHRFPATDAERLGEWLQNIHRPDWTPGPTDRLCSKHFTSDQFYTIGGKRRLLDEAVPTVFDGLPKPVRPKRPRKRALRRDTGSNASTSTMQAAQIRGPRKQSTGEALKNSQPVTDVSPKSCRICLSLSEETSSLFLSSYANTPLSDILSELVNLKIERDERLPHQICYPCTTQLVSIFEFKKCCISTEAELQIMLKHDAESYDLCDSKVEFVLKDEEEGDWSTSPTRVKHIGEIDPESLSSGTDFKLMELVVPELVSTFTESSKESLNVLPDSAPPSEVDLDENGEAAPPVTKENPYSCGFYECLEVFPCRTDLALHRNEFKHPERTSGPPPGFRFCSRCDRSFMTKKSYYCHMHRHKADFSYQECICEVCGKKISSSTNLQKHMKTHIGNGSHICDVCGKAFMESIILEDHMAQTHGIGERNYTIRKAFPPLEKRFACNVCGRRFGTKQNMLNHRRTHTGEMPFMCKVCGRCFRTDGTLYTHMRKHTGEKPYRCRTCGQSFTQSQHLARHNLIHTDEKPHTCPFCEKPFRHKNNLVVHVRIHTKEKPYVCVVCGQGFYAANMLKKHKAKHPIENMKTEEIEIVDESFIALV